MQLGAHAVERRARRRMRKLIYSAARRHHRLWRLPAQRLHAHAGRGHPGGFRREDFATKPSGVFERPDQAGLLHLFERGGKPILVASEQQSSPARRCPSPWAPSRSGSPTIKETRPVADEDWIARLPLRPLPCFIEGADLDVLKLNLVPTTTSPRRGRKRDRS